MTGCWAENGKNYLHSKKAFYSLQNDKICRINLDTINIFINCCQL
jgi:hypothetical protein